MCKVSTSAFCRLNQRFPKSTTENTALRRRGCNKHTVLYIVVPCYNEEAVLPIIAPMFLRKLRDLSVAGRISPDSRVLFVNDGSKDKTWEIICSLTRQDLHYLGNL